MQTERNSTYAGERWPESDPSEKCGDEPTQSVVDECRVDADAEGALKKASSTDIDRRAARRAAMSKLPA